MASLVVAELHGPVDEGRGLPAVQGRAHGESRGAVREVGQEGGQRGRVDG